MEKCCFKMGRKTVVGLSLLTMTLYGVGLTVLVAPVSRRLFEFS
jgi:hypothetical protein